MAIKPAAGPTRRSHGRPPMLAQPRNLAQVADLRSSRLRSERHKARLRARVASQPRESATQKAAVQIPLELLPHEPRQRELHGAVVDGAVERLEVVLDDLVERRLLRPACKLGTTSSTSRRWTTSYSSSPPWSCSERAALGTHGFAVAPSDHMTTNELLQAPAPVGSTGPPRLPAWTPLDRICPAHPIGHEEVERRDLKWLRSRPL